MLLVSITFVENTKSIHQVEVIISNQGLKATAVASSFLQQARQIYKLLQCPP